jgi:hypothetical protein
MGFELTAQFRDATWYHEHRDQIKKQIFRLPSFVNNPTDDEFWLKDASYGNPWDFDVRLFVKEQGLVVEISAFSNAFTVDTKNLYQYLSDATKVIFVDDDSELFSF